MARTKGALGEPYQLEMSMSIKADLIDAMKLLTNAAKLIVEAGKRADAMSEEYDRKREVA